MGVHAAGADRLPWLTDEPSTETLSRRSPSLMALAAAAVVLVGAGGFWMGVRSVEEMPGPVAQHGQPTVTLPLPPSATTAPEVELPVQRDVRPAAAREVRPVTANQVHISVPVRVKAAPAGSLSPSSSRKLRSSERAAKGAPGSLSPAELPLTSAIQQPVVLVPWNPRVLTGAAGRLVQVGAFGSVLQAKRGWWFMVREYPAMADLPALVRPTRNSKGRTFFRFQVGTTSQAHSEVLCQRMAKIRLSCAVLGLPWKEKVER